MLAFIWDVNYFFLHDTTKAQKLIVFEPADCGDLSYLTDH